MHSKTPKTSEISENSPLTLTEVLEIIEACRKHGVQRLVFGEMIVEFAQSSARDTHAATLSPGEQLARDSAVSSYAAPSAKQSAEHQESIKALQTMGMNKEMNAWTEASAPSLFDEEM